MRILLTNDDGIDADGLQALRRGLREVPGVELAVIAPDGNRSAIGRGIKAGVGELESQRKALTTEEAVNLKAQQLAQQAQIQQQKQMANLA